MKSKIMEEMRREQAGYRRGRMARERQCYACGGRDHMVRDCPTRPRGNDLNKRSSLYYHERPVRAVAQIQATSRREMHVPERKRIRATGSLEELVERHPEVLKGQKSEIEFHQGEKCRIKTKRGEKVVQKGQIASQSLKEKTRKYLKDLEKRKVIRKSSSRWRTPIRAIEKLDGGV